MEEKLKLNSKSGKPKKVTNLPKEISDLIIDTQRYKEKTDSTKILENLRYKAV